MPNYAFIKKQCWGRTSLETEPCVGSCVPWAHFCGHVPPFPFLGAVKCQMPHFLLLRSNDPSTWKCAMSNQTTQKNELKHDWCLVQKLLTTAINDWLNKMDSGNVDGVAECHISRDVLFPKLNKLIIGKICLSWTLSWGKRWLMAHSKHINKQNWRMSE